MGPIPTQPGYIGTSEATGGISQPSSPIFPGFLLDSQPRLAYTAVLAPSRQNAQIAQLVEQRTENPRVGGSNPPLGTIFCLAARSASGGAANDCRRAVAPVGSSD